VAVATFAAVGALVSMSSVAAASNPPIGISDDGVTYGSSLPGPLFQGVQLVPGGSATRSFWVKNTGPSGANMAITLIDVAAADPAFLSALTITAQAGTHSGSARFDHGGDCISLVHGVPLAKDAAVRIDVTLSMANVGGTTGQNAVAAFNLGVRLTSDDVSAPTGCAGSSEPQPPPTPNPTPTGGDDSGGGTVVIPGVTPPTPTPAPVPTTTPTPAPSPSESPAPSPSPEPTDPDDAPVQWNTDRLYQEWFVAAWVIEFILGGYFAWRSNRRQQGEGNRA
jgi:hypothetical protein